MKGEGRRERQREEGRREGGRKEKREGGAYLGRWSLLAPSALPLVPALHRLHHDLADISLAQPSVGGREERRG